MLKATVLGDSMVPNRSADLNWMLYLPSAVKAGGFLGSYGCQVAPLSTLKAVEAPLLVVDRVSVTGPAYQPLLPCLPASAAVVAGGVLPAVTDWPAASVASVCP